MQHQLATIPDPAPTLYHKLGFWIGPRLFTDDDVKKLSIACTRVLSGDLGGRFSPYFMLDETQPKGGLRRAFNSTFVDPVLHDALHHSKIGEMAARLMGVEVVRLWYSQIIEKPAASSEQEIDTRANVGWHQDYRYWQCCDRSNLLTAWIALQKTTRANGGMRFVIGSNNWGLIPTERGFNTRQLDDLKMTLHAGITNDWTEEECNLEVGQVSFHHCLTLHGSGPNCTADSRTGIAVHLMPGGTKRRDDAACHPSLTFLGPMPGPTEVFAGEQWPIIWERAQSTCLPEA
ncbi:MAG TPA: phytanoyl-CoA dioxygenase family protein [Terracidiphilus sp.]|nr:phytanoyl-CoA dioxygenase family protein [Terracidiphilus sp.]